MGKVPGDRGKDGFQSLPDELALQGGGAPCGFGLRRDRVWRGFIPDGLFVFAKSKMEKFQTEGKRWVERLLTTTDSKLLKTQSVVLALRHPEIKVGMIQHTSNKQRLIISEMSLPVRAVQKSSGEQVLWVFLNTVSF